MGRGDFVYLEGGSAHGALTLRGSVLSIETVGANCHSCSLDGTLSGRHGVVRDADAECRLTVAPDGATSLTVTVDGEDADGACRAYCGARASFTGRYARAPAARIGRQRSNRVEQSRRQYAAKDYDAARTTLQALLAECATFMDWLEADRVRNDLALAQFHLGAPELCLQTLGQTLAGRAHGEDDLALPPCDRDNDLPTARATWHNRALCQAAGKP